jgi:hypothetical protein
MNTNTSVIEWCVAGLFEDRFESHLIVVTKVRTHAMTGLNSNNPLPLDYINFLMQA